MTTTEPPVLILKWIWGDPLECMTALQKAVDENDAKGIKIGRKKLEKELKRLKSLPSDWRMVFKRKAAIAEVEAKIATVVAIQSGKPEDWTAAAEKYDGLVGRFNILADDCSGSEDIARICFECDAKEAMRYAATCVAKTKGDSPEVYKTELERRIPRKPPNSGWRFV